MNKNEKVLLITLWIVCSLMCIMLCCCLELLNHVNQELQWLRYYALRAFQKTVNDRF